ncbi:hypothetical protein BU24DRAFT_410816 [Aaosphaeria arxii CBS 175.79]|uniref:Uncharacterized protein n=1 Tax=Aaosphaeria arxii CBS 175.79 TaxID=1450172 RepID=A0A6A5XPS1_9PLEO|nr:uncharacterized protein BU24DRAFT_410816 [Aaosphaeria arxii CBS 175.79]KAF2015142.1 hypothetical protein BU24DRAFT_410816 [Aaosphaeria arxii CBS 175.79]
MATPTMVATTLVVPTARIRCNITSRICGEEQVEVSDRLNKETIGGIAGGCALLVIACLAFLFGEAIIEVLFTTLGEVLSATLESLSPSEFRRRKRDREEARAREVVAAALGTVVED